MGRAMHSPGLPSRPIGGIQGALDVRDQYGPVWALGSPTVMKNPTRADMDERMIKLLAPKKEDCMFSTTPKQVARAFGFTRCAVRVREYTAHPPSNPAAYPGVSYRTEGIQRKGDAWPEVEGFAAALVDDLNRGVKRNGEMIFAMGSREKRMTLDDWRAGKPARSIVMPEAHEEAIARHVFGHLYDVLKDSQRVAYGMGWNDDGIADRLGRAQKHYCFGDIASFDVSVSKRLLRYAIDVLLHGVRFESVRAMAAWRQFLYQLYGDGFICGVNGDIYRLRGGMKTGSFITTLLNSVMSYTVIYDTMSRMGYTMRNWRVVVLGDNFVCSTRSEERLFVSDFSSHMDTYFGMTLKASETGTCGALASGVEPGVTFLGRRFDGRDWYRLLEDSIDGVCELKRQRRSDFEEKQLILALYCDNPGNPVFVDYLKCLVDHKVFTGSTYGRLLWTEVREVMNSDNRRRILDASRHVVGSWRKQRVWRAGLALTSEDLAEWQARLLSYKRVEGLETDIVRTLRSSEEIAAYLDAYAVYYATDTQRLASEEYEEPDDDSEEQHDIYRIPSYREWGRWIREHAADAVRPLGASEYRSLGLKRAGTPLNTLGRVVRTRTLP
uniref:RdRp n=1 Tax=Plasmopara viticola lesion associated picorna-like virus 1 TaxID=2692077 RepID=A0A6B9Q426_9VIRU|nr:RdRp [Plasmopara viticola lesion associated picorna-like virus 1]